jgi:hypothetical protein
MSLLTYEEVRPWARSIKARTERRDKPDTMPPWYIEKNIGIQRYKEDQSLSDEEIALIGRWVDSGAPRGNPADMPPPREFADAAQWQIGQPDLVVTSPSFEMPAVAPTGAAGRWPTHEVGRNADFFDPAAGHLLPAGSQITFANIHAHANGKRTKAHVDVGFKFHPKGYHPTKNFVPFNIYNTELDVHGMEANQKAEGFFVLPQNMKLILFEPHMHASGVRMCLDAIWENTAETLTCAGYNHSWVRVYTYADDAAPLLPKGTILRGTGYFDSTPANKNVADPRNWSGLGHRSMDNMSITILSGMFLSDDEFVQEMAKRREKLQLADGQTVIGCPLCGYLKGYQQMLLKKPTFSAATQQ